jgi:hypothetical protein
MFHAFTRYDTDSAFVGRGSKTCWEAWKECPGITVALEALSNSLQNISSPSLALLERYVVLLYRSCICVNVNAARKKPFAQKGKTVRNIQPTQNALMLHV